MALPRMQPGFILAEQPLDENGKVAGEVRGRAIVVLGEAGIPEGAAVLFYEYAAYEVLQDGKTYLVIRVSDIFGVYE